ncbi:MAG: hypothetical protein WD045_03230 [Pirellulaceae bacterium]
MTVSFTYKPGCWALALLAAGAIGCQSGARILPDSPPMLGADVDAINQIQEENAEAAKFVIYQHEFVPNFLDTNGDPKAWRLNEDGEDHVKQIATNLLRGVEMPVVVERSRTTARPDTEYGYAVHLNDQLDQQRRQVVVNSLVAMGVEDADGRVVVAPAFSEGLTSPEAVRAYNMGLSGGRGGAGFGGGFGGMGGGGGFGGFGGGF